VHLASQIDSAIQVLLGLGLIGLVLMHSGKDSGLSGLGVGGGSSHAGTAVMERNLTRLTIVVAIAFALNGILLGYLLNH
jgi:preprotein translocase subunit SecG